MKDIFLKIILAILSSIDVPLALFIGIKMTPLGKLGKAAFQIGRKAAAPLAEGARNVSGRIAHWGAGRGIVGRTVARVATGAVLPGGRARMERIGEAHRKGQSERTAARGGYRMSFRDSSNPDALERATPEALASLVVGAEAGDTGKASTLAALRRMAHETPTLRLSTKQRDALFGGSGAQLTDPVTGAPTGALVPQARSARGSNLRIGDWWNERPKIIPSGRNTGETRRGALGRHATDWTRWWGALRPPSENYTPIVGGAFPRPADQAGPDRGVGNDPEVVWPRFRRPT